jgi:hypothetical protein
MRGWTVRVTRTDEPEATFTVTPRCMVEFERFFKIGVGRAFQEEQRLEHVYWLAWKATNAAGVTVPVFDAWLDTVVDVELETEAVPFDASPTHT